MVVNCSVSRKVLKKVAALLDQLDASVSYQKYENETGCSISVEVAGKGYIGYGYAKCGPKDEFDKALGRTIAIGRARMSLARNYLAGFYYVLEDKQ